MKRLINYFLACLVLTGGTYEAGGFDPCCLEQMCGELDVGAGVIYWTTCTDESRPLATTEVEGFLINQSDFFTCYGFDAGFYVYSSYRLCEYELFAQYTQFCTTGSFNQFGLIVPTTIFGDNGFWNYSNHIDWKYVDIILQKRLSVCDTTLIPFVGYKGMSLRQKSALKLSTTEPSGPLPEIVTNFPRGTNESCLTANGIQIGSHAEFSFCDGFFLRSTLGFSLMEGELDNRNISNQPGQFPFETTANGKRCLPVYEIHAGVGVGYESEMNLCGCIRSIGFYLGYDAHELHYLQRLTYLVEPTIPSWGFLVHGVKADLSIGF